MRKRRKLPEFFRRERPDGTVAPTLWTRVGGQRVSTGTSNLKAAKRWKERKLIERADPRRAAAEKATLADAMRELYAELRRRGRAAATQKRAKQKLGHFPRLWGEHCKLASIDAQKIGEYIDVRETDPGLGEGTVKRITIRDELAFLRQLLKLARRQGKYPYAIEDVMPILFETGHKPKKDWATPEQLEKLLSHVEKGNAAHLLFFVVTAGRLADSFRACRADFDTAKWRATVRGSKTEGSYRTIPISDFMRPYVERMLADADGWNTNAAGEALLFDAWPNIHRSLREAAGRAGVPAVTTNGLRRTFGKLHRMNGYSLDTISKLFGHTTAKLVRDVYADVEGDELAEVMDREGAGAKHKLKTGTG